MSSPTATEIAVPGARLAVDVVGEGQSLVMLHGLAGDRRHWDLLWRDLAIGRRLVRYDLRGFGASTAVDDAEFRHSQDLKNLLDQLCVERCDLVGLSLGGSIALNFALDHPSRVNRLALISPAITGWEWSDEWRAAWRAIVAVARAGDIECAREAWFGHALFSTTRAHRAARMLRDGIWAYDGGCWARQDREAAALPDLDRLPLLSVRTLLLTGSDDVADFRLIAEFIETSAPNVCRIDYRSAGHMLNLERPADVAAELNRFFCASS